MEIVRILGQVFNWALSHTPAAIVIVILILLARRWLEGRVSPKLLYWLWLILMVRLLLPGFITSLPLPLPGSTSHDAMYGAGAGSAWIPFQADQEPRLAEGQLDSALLSTMGDAALHNKDAMASTSLNAWWDAAFAVWSIGVVCISVWMIVTWIVMRRNLAVRNITVPGSDIAEWFSACKQALGVRQAVELHTTSRVSTPAVYGIWKPRILLPSAMVGRLSREEWTCIFTHELIHIQRRDAWWNALMTALLIVHWFNPLMWKAYFSMREDQELSCDSAALTHVDHVGYGKTLFKLIELSPKVNRLSYMPFHSGKKQLLKRRMKMIMLKKKPVLTLFALTMIVLFAGAMFAIPAITAQTTDEAASELTVDFTAPTEGRITINYGEERRNNRSESIFYESTAIANEEGTPIKAAADGIVLTAEYVRILGNVIRIQHDDHFETVYAHLETLEVEAGERVKQGQLIGKMGSTGRSTGPHLEFQLLKDGESVDSAAYIDYSALHLPHSSQ